ncbi:DUF58 domain-containing protein [Anaerobacillus sp. MEB173]|uniref:DUF58 domain-containing protein n=1 Tax=Anaerobacillus sp. MEB173 TaxID=3383345 RepID=UPI003F8F819F
MKRLNPKIRFVINIVILVIIFLATYVYGMFQGGFVSWFLFYSVTFLLISALVVLAFPFNRLVVTREIHKQVFTTGEKVTVTVRVKRESMFPFLFLQLKDRLPEELEKTGDYQTNKLFFFSLKKELVFSYDLKLISRGEYHLNAVEVGTGDFFGLVTKVKNFKVMNTLLVYPEYQDLRNLSVITRDEVQSMNSQNEYGDDIASISGVRDYVQGDRLNNIHWKASARASKLMTKEFEVYDGQSYLLIFDCALVSKHYQSVMLFERAVELAASIVRYSMQNKIMLGFVAAGDKIKKLPIQCSDEHQMNIFQQLAKLNYTNRSRFSEVMNDNVIPNGTTVLVISTTVTEETVKSMYNLDLQKTKVAFFLVTDGLPGNKNEQLYMNELKKMNIVPYVMKSKIFNDDLKAGEKHVRS